MFVSQKYGFQTKEPISNNLEEELFAYRWGWPVEKGGLGRAGHFKQIVNLLWGPQNKNEHFVWHPWADRMNWVCHEYQYAALSGCSSSGKTRYAAMFAIVNWLSDPGGTLVLVTTTGLKDAQARIWGAIEKYWLAAPGLPGQLLSSQYQIYTTQAGQKMSGQCGIQLVAGEKRKEKESMGKLIGRKADRVFLIADEMPELSEGLVTTAMFNLKNNPQFSMIGIGNFKTRYDPFGLYVAPKEGWDSIGIETEEWETERGYCCRFDGTKSANVTAGKVLYKGLYDHTQLAADRKNQGENTAAFYRMCRSFEAPIGLDDAIYCESDFVAGGAYEVAGRDCLWDDRQHRWSALDPSFTNGGDRSMQLFGWVGLMGGKMVVSVDKSMSLREDIRIRDKTRSRQIAEQFRDNCLAENVKPEHAAIDATAGGGIVLADLITEVWSNKVLRVDFSGAPTESWIGADRLKKARDAYDRRVSELWGVGREFLKYGQLKGITQELAREMKARKFDSVKGAMGLKMRVETKVEMKARLGFSPDCFIGETLVSTSSGQRSIKDIKEGDLVWTPFGSSPVVKVHVQKVTELSSVGFSDGQTLKGKGTHRVFTYDRGWVGMDSLSLTNDCESVKSRPLWQLLNLLFTKDKSITFKAAVDIIKTETRLRRRDFFIESSGLSVTGLFRKALVSIIRMVTGPITQTATCNSWKLVPTQLTTCANDLKTQSLNAKTESIWIKLSRRLCFGIDLKKGSDGTRSTVGNLGEIEKKINRANVSNAALNFYPSKNPPGFAPIGAGSARIIQIFSFMAGIAWSVAKAFWLTNTSARCIVPQSVATIRLDEPVEVYNLTLLEDNAYYANGILVENCADAYFVGLDLCRQRLGLVAGGPDSHYGAAHEDWDKQCRLANQIYANANYTETAA